MASKPSNRHGFWRKSFGINESSGPSPFPQLFDLEKDLSEAHNLAESRPEKAAELNQLLSARLKQVGAQMPSLNPDYTPSASRDRGRPGARRGGRPSGPRRLRGI